MRQQQTLPPKDWQILSEFLDGQLSSREQNRLEERLRAEPELRAALDSLRGTRAVLRSVRMQRVPRNFTLTPAMVEQTRPKPLLRLVPVLNFASALAALAVVIVLAVQFLPGATAAAPAAAPQAPQTTLTTSLKAAPPAAESTPLIMWGGGSGAASNQATGMGGGGGEGPRLPSGPASKSGLWTPTPGPEMSNPAAAAPVTTQAAPMIAPALPEAPQAAPDLTSTQAPALIAPLSPTPTPETAAGSAPFAPAPGQGNENRQLSGGPQSPILGVQPPAQAEVQNQVALDQAQQANESQAQPQKPVYWPVAAALAVIALGSLAASLVIRRRARG